MQLANIFAYDIDFAQDLRDGDSFSVVYEELYRDGERIRGGGILAARFVNHGKPYEAVRFARDDGSAGYFDATGRPLQEGVPAHAGRVHAHQLALLVARASTRSSA